MKDDKKKKKGVAIVIAVTPHAPKKPENTMKPDEKMEKAWSTLKADPSQQLLEPRQVTTRGGGLAFSPYTESASRFTPQGTMHPAITGMMERQGISQPKEGQYQYANHAITPTENPVQRMPANYDLTGRLKPENPKYNQAETHTGPAFHGANETYFGQPGDTAPNPIAVAMDPSVRNALPMPLPMTKAWAMIKDSARYRPELDEDPRTKQEIQDERGNAIDEYYDMLEGFGIRDDDDDDDDDDIEPITTKPMQKPKSLQQMIIDNIKNNSPEGVERSLDDEGNINQ